MKYLEFDTAAARALVNAKQKRIGAFLDNHQELHTALDVGCGVGIFADMLRTRGLQVHAIDGRPENVAEGRKRYPFLSVEVGNAETFSIAEQYDLVLALGILYHLENPLQTVRRLAALTKQVLYIESMVILNEGCPIMHLVDEGRTVSQGLSYHAFIPSPSCLVKMLYIAGFPFVYRDEPFFQERHKGKYTPNRLILIASKTPIADRFVRRMPNTHAPKPGYNVPFRRRLSMCWRALYVRT